MNEVVILLKIIQEMEMMERYMEQLGQQAKSEEL
jgi:hypothetical protein